MPLEMLVLPALVPGVLLLAIRTLFTLAPAPVPKYLQADRTTMAEWIASRERVMARRPRP